MVLLFGIGLSLVLGFLIHAMTVILLPGAVRERFSRVVPLYARPTYAMLLYILSGLSFAVASWLVRPGGWPATILLALFCLIAASQVVRLFAHLRGRSLEDSYEEEIERKRRNSY